MTKIEKIRKIGCMFLATSIAFTFCSCGKKSSENGSSSGNSNSTSSNNINSKTAVAYHAPEAIKNRGELNVGVPNDDLSYVFFKDKDENNFGYAVNFSEEIAKKIGENVKINYISKSSVELLDLVSNGDVDLAIGSFDNAGILKKNFSVSNSYWPMTVDPIFVYAKNGQESNYTDESSLKNKKIAVVSNSNEFSFVSTFVPDAELIECDNIEACVEKVVNGEADLIASEDAEWNGTGIESDAKDNPDISKCSVTIPANPADIGMFVPVMLGNTELVDLLNNVIKEILDGDLYTNKISVWLTDAYNKYIDLNNNSDDLSDKTEEETQN